MARSQLPSEHGLACAQCPGRKMVGRAYIDIATGVALAAAFPWVARRTPAPRGLPSPSEAWAGRYLRAQTMGTPRTYRPPHDGCSAVHRDRSTEGTMSHGLHASASISRRRRSMSFKRRSSLACQVVAYTSRLSSLAVPRQRRLAACHAAAKPPGPAASASLRRRTSQSSGSMPSREAPIATRSGSPSIRHAPISWWPSRSLALWCCRRRRAERMNAILG
jgi:hypothetical protein